MRYREALVHQLLNRGSTYNPTKTSLESTDSDASMRFMVLYLMGL